MNKTLKKLSKLTVISDAKSDITLKERAATTFDKLSLFVRNRIRSKAFSDDSNNTNKALWYRKGDKTSYCPEHSLIINMQAVSDYPFNRLYVLIGLVDSGDNDYNYRNGVFYRSLLGGLPTICLYLFNSGIRDNNKLDVDEVISRLKHDNKIKSVFIHEYTHFYNYLQKEDKGSKKPEPKYSQPDENYKDYINHPLEINARYLEIINRILDSFVRLLRVRENGIKGAFPTFQDFMAFYWSEPGYIPPSLKNNIRNSNGKRILKRLYKFYDFITKDEDFTREQALKFAKHQAEIEERLSKL